MTEAAAIFELLLYMCWSHETPDHQRFRVYIYGNAVAVAEMVLDDGAGFAGVTPDGSNKWCAELTVPLVTPNQRVTWDVAAVDPEDETNFSMASNGPSYRVCGVRPCIGRVVSSPATEGT